MKREAASQGGNWLASMQTSELRLAFRGLNVPVLLFRFPLALITVISRFRWRGCE